MNVETKGSRRDEKKQLSSEMGTDKKREARFCVGGFVPDPRPLSQSPHACKLSELSLVGLLQLSAASELIADGDQL
jgi:hypothetical protein